MPTSPPPPTDSDDSAALVRALRRLLRPLVRLLLNRGLTLPALVEVLKRIYVESAEQDFPIDGRAVSDSRISLLTGVHRKDVRRLRQPPDAVEPAGPRLSLGIQLVSTWLADPAFLDPAGRPRALPRRGERGTAGFEDLVAQVCRQDIRPRAMLDELLRLRVVELDESDQIRLTRPAFVPDSSLAGKSVYFGRNIGDHIAAGAHNLLDGRPPMLERSVHYSRLSAEHAAELERLARQRAESMLGEINREGMRRQADSAAEPGHRINFGVYCYVDPAPVAPSEAGHEQTD